MEMIANDLDIRKGDNEDLEHWHKRVFYSSIGLNMLTATYDYDDDNVYQEDNGADTVSMQHIHNRAVELATIIGNTVFDQNDADAMREIYIKAGYMLHRANRLTYPPEKHSLIGEICISRGQAPWNVQHMSGLGTFIVDDEAKSLIHWDDMFCVEKKGILDWYRQFEKILTWSKTNRIPENVEYANIFEDTTSGYWLNRPPQKGTTIYRDKRNGERQYGLLKITDQYETASLPNWRTAKLEYLRITLPLRILSGYVPIIRIRHNGAAAELYSEYLLPPAEQNIYELFSWPNTENSHWNRIISIQILPLMKELFTRMGFTIDEE